MSLKPRALAVGSGSDARPNSSWGRSTGPGMMVLARRMVAAVTLSLVFWEGMLRAFVSSPIPFHHDPVLGWMPKPHSSGLYAWEGRATCRYNEWGFRDDPIVPRVAGETRIACLGDSYTEGTQLEVEQTFSFELQRRLREAGRPARVFNGGRSGTAVPQLIGLAGPYLSIFQPDWVVLLIRDGWGEAFNPDHEFHYVADGDGFKVVRSWHWERMSTLKRLMIQFHVRDVALFQYGIRHFAELRRVPGGQPTADDAGRQAQLRAIDWTLPRLKQEYPNLVIVHIPYGSASLDGLMPASPMEEGLVADCLRHGIPCIPMRPVIENDFARLGRPPFGFANTLPWAGHPNEHGHDLIARELDTFFRKTLAN